jgi:hypothetical protein
MDYIIRSRLQKKMQHGKTETFRQRALPIIQQVSLQP